MTEQRAWGWFVLGNPAPLSGTQEYIWWRRGATDEHFLERDGLDREAIELLEVIRSLGRARPDMTAYALVKVAAEIYGWELRDPAGDEVPQTPTSAATPGTGPHGDFGCCASSATEIKRPATTVE